MSTGNNVFEDPDSGIEYIPVYDDDDDSMMTEELPTNPKMTDANAEPVLHKPEYALEEGRLSSESKKEHPSRPEQAAKSPISSARKRRNARTRAVLIGVAMIVVGVVIVALVLGVDQDNNNERSIAAPSVMDVTDSPVTTDSLTDSPTASPVTTAAPTDVSTTLPVSSNSDFDTTVTTESPTAPTPPTTTIEEFVVTDACHAVVTALDKRHQGLVRPAHLASKYAVVRDGDFDVDEYWGAFQHITRKRELAMHYVYNFDFLTGYPILYSRKWIHFPFQDASDYRANCPDEDSCSYLKSFQVDGSPESYVEVVALYIMGQQFYLYGHATFNDDVIVYNNESLHQVFEEHSFHQYAEEGDLYTLHEEDLEELENMDISPTVVMDSESDQVVVKVVTFTKWGGFFRRTYAVTKGDGDGEVVKVEKVNDEVLVYYVKGILH